MSILLFSIGGFAFVAGLIVAGFGIPDSEFSFGNTLIIAGTTSAVGGLIVIGLGAVVSQLRQVIEALSTQVPNRPTKASESYQPASRAASASSQIPFPSTPKSEPSSSSPHIPEQRPTMPAASAVSPLSGQAARSFTPTLSNPDEAPVTGAEEAILSQQYRSALQPTSAPDQQRRTYFEATRAIEIGSEKPASGAETEFDPPPVEAYESDTISPQWVEKPCEIPILKSGVVDGMGYTLYVDGSIEAELPEGILRFASIDELRSHLENAS